MSSPWAAYQDFHHFIDAQLRHLLRDHGFDAWLLTRVQGKRQQVLAWQGHGTLPVLLGQQFDWQASHGRRVLHENAAPLLSANAEQSDPLQALSGCGSLIALPLLSREQHPLGVLYGLTSATSSNEPDSNACLLHLTKLIGYCLQQALAIAREERVHGFMEQTSLCPLTGVLDRNGWQAICEQEQQRVQYLGEQSCVVTLNAYPGSDPLIIADSLAALLRSEDAIAHLGDGQFAVALPHACVESATRVSGRIKDALNAKGILLETQVAPLSAAVATVSEPG